nr:hypothetical protein CFP56_42059 [Quercus suber]
MKEMYSEQSFLSTVVLMTSKAEQPLQGWSYVWEKHQIPRRVYVCANSTAFTLAGITPRHALRLRAPLDMHPSTHRHLFPRHYQTCHHVVSSGGPAAAARVHSFTAGLMSRTFAKCDDAFRSIDRAAMTGMSA